MIFWRYHERTRNHIWLTKEKYHDRDLKMKNKSKIYYDEKHKQYYLNNRDEILKYHKENWDKSLLLNPFNHLLYTIKSGARNRKLLLDIKVDDLMEIYNQQKELCFYTGVKMIIERKSNSPYQASIDRKDSSIGYIKENIVFCCQSINFAKNRFSVEDFNNFLINISLSIIEKNKQSILNIKELIK
jgi:hypothetical protein